MYLHYTRHILNVHSIKVCGIFRAGDLIHVTVITVFSPTSLVTQAHHFGCKKERKSVYMRACSINYYEGSTSARCSGEILGYYVLLLPVHTRMRLF